MTVRIAFACALVVGGVACIVTSVSSGTKLDTAYVDWSKARMAAESPTVPISQRSSIAGAPLSILSPSLIWISVIVGLVLILIGVLVGLLSKSAATPRERRNRPDDEAPI
jgi:hypothetical protein